MAQIVTITNPLTGQPAQVDQLDHTAQQIDDAIGRALPGGEIDAALLNKENSFSILPLNKGGTGVNDLAALRKVIGICTNMHCEGGKSIDITLPSSGAYLISASDNVRYGAILVQTGANGVLKKITELAPLTSWSYAKNSNVLTLSETGGTWSVRFAVTSISESVYSGG